MKERRQPHMKHKVRGKDGELKAAAKAAERQKKECDGEILLVGESGLRVKKTKAKKKEGEKGGRLDEDPASYPALEY